LLFLQDYNTQVVVLGTMLLGLAAGTVGCFTLLRRRALMGDALSHATLPGVGLAFLLAPLFGLDGKSLPVLLAGGTLSGLAGVAAILYVRNFTRLKEDAALGIVLSVFFGAGVSILTVAQSVPGGSAAGLESFIYGKTASMTASDAMLIGGAGLICVLIVIALFKELTLLCFDEGYAASRGYPVVILDLLIMALVVTITMIGLQAVGLVLMIALLVIPAAAARFWTQNLRTTTWISACIGGLGGLIGSGLSAVIGDLPSGPAIVLVCSSLFFVSMLLGTSRGVIVRWLRRRQLNQNVDHQHLLRGLYELTEAQTSVAATDVQGVSFDLLLASNSWSAFRLNRAIERCRREGLVERQDNAALRLTSAGFQEASRLAHEHRLWEMYLITHADIAPARVDQSADAIEHVLEPELIVRLEELLRTSRNREGVLPSPHPLDSPGGAR
jgi:manganese/zinc/iron transport system permease protein